MKNTGGKSRLYERQGSRETVERRGKTSAPAVGDSPSAVAYSSLGTEFFQREKERLTSFANQRNLLVDMLNNNPQRIGSSSKRKDARALMEIDVKEARIIENLLNVSSMSESMANARTLSRNGSKKVEAETIAQRGRKQGKMDMKELSRSFNCGDGLIDEPFDATVNHTNLFDTAMKDLNIDLLCAENSLARDTINQRSTSQARIDSLKRSTAMRGTYAKENLPCMNTSFVSTNGKSKGDTDLKQKLHKLQKRDASYRLEISKLKASLEEAKTIIQAKDKTIAQLEKQCETDRKYIIQIDQELTSMRMKQKKMEKAGETVSSSCGMQKASGAGRRVIELEKENAVLRRRGEELEAILKNLLMERELMNRRMSKINQQGLPNQGEETEDVRRRSFTSNSRQSTSTISGENGLHASQRTHLSEQAFLMPKATQYQDKDIVLFHPQGDGVNLISESDFEVYNKLTPSFMDNELMLTKSSQPSVERFSVDILRTKESNSSRFEQVCDAPPPAAPQAGFHMSAARYEQMYANPFMQTN
eukprot:TRINITY_DN4785_c0_g2_i8.p1 TRINITY_DN4785_c0_g2~~TRINITY_DN4785_c0_g2_i8.p1  ORF type:complete len:533 (-),score=137.01 TRINITY_DN4785_c0_g2_i8:159-1757(-)